MEKKYFLQENGKVSQPYSLDDLWSKNITADILVCEKFGSWKAAKDIPELAELIEWHPAMPTESDWVPPPLKAQAPLDKAKHLNPDLAKSRNIISHYKTPLIIALIIIVAGLFIFRNYSCNEEGEKFLGTWKSGERNVIKIGRTDLLIFCNYWVDVSIATRGGSSYNSFGATYEDGFLKISDDHVLSYLNGKIIYNGNAYKKTN